MLLALGSAVGLKASGGSYLGATPGSPLILFRTHPPHPNRVRFDLLLDGEGVEYENGGANSGLRHFHCGIEYSEANGHFKVGRHWVLYHYKGNRACSPDARTWSLRGREAKP